MLNITGDIQKNIYSLISFKIDSVLSLFMLALDLFFFISVSKLRCELGEAL